MINVRGACADPALEPEEGGRRGQEAAAQDVARAAPRAEGYARRLTRRPHGARAAEHDADALSGPRRPHALYRDHHAGRGYVGGSRRPVQGRRLPLHRRDQPQLPPRPAQGAVRAKGTPRPHADLPPEPRPGRQRLPEHPARGVESDPEPQLGARRAPVPLPRPEPRRPAEQGYVARSPQRPPRTCAATAAHLPAA